MATRSPNQVYADLIAVGMTPAQATVMTAIAGAESGYDDRALGDTSLETSTWGPSYGLYQIRTLKGQTGSGSDRDISALASDAAQARAAYDISAHGTDFSAWTTYTNGAYRQYLSGAQTAASATPVGLGPDWLPWNWGSALSDGARQVLDGVWTIAMQVSGGILGLGLIYAGALTMVRPRAMQAAGELRTAAAKVAA